MTAEQTYQIARLMPIVVGELAVIIVILFILWATILLRK